MRLKFDLRFLGCPPLPPHHLPTNSILTRKILAWEAP